jgi:hypothetical protein
MALTLHTNVVEERGFVDLTQADYLEPLFDDMDRVLELAERRLEPIDFDTIVVTGMSGALVGAPLAHHLHKHLVVVRKADRWRPAGSQRPSNPLGDLFAVAPPLDPGYQTITDADF